MKLKNIILFTLPFVSLQALANLPTGGKFIGSQGNIINTTANKISIIGNNAHNVIVWDSFNISNNYSVEFNHKNFLNLVKGTNGTSKIDGSLNGLGSVYIVNPNGITIGNNAKIKVSDNFALSTAKVSDKNIDNFLKTGSLEITKKGMGKVKLLGEVKTTNLIVDAGQIIIKDYANIKNMKGNIPLVNSDKNVVSFNSSTKRIDIGGKNHFDIEKSYNLSSNSGVVNHIGKEAISSKDDFLNIKNNMKADYWLCDDLDLGTINSPISQDAFTGKLDGAFNNLSYTLTVDRATSDMGLFTEIKNAEIKNLKIDSTINVSNTNSNINVSSLGGKMQSSKIENVIVNTQASLVDNNGTITIAPLAGTSLASSTHNSFKNVETSYSENKTNSNSVKAGSFIGVNEDNLDIDGYIYAKNIKGLKAIFQDNNNTDIKTDKKGALERAKLSSSFANDYLVNGDNAYLKGFLRPFFTEDFTFEYDGTTHNYLPLIASKYDWFDIKDYFDIKGKDGFIQAGVHKISFNDSKNNYYFVDPNHEISKQGFGRLTITKRDLGQLDFANAEITEGDKLPEFIVTNKDSLNFVGQDSLKDLDLQFDIVDFNGKEGSYKVIAKSNNDNYSFTQNEFTLTVKESNIKPLMPLNPAIKKPIAQTEITVIATPRVPINVNDVDVFTDCSMCKNLDKLTALKINNKASLSDNLLVSNDMTLAQNTNERGHISDEEQEEESSSYLSFNIIDKILEFFSKDEFQSPIYNEGVDTFATVYTVFNVENIVDQDIQNKFNQKMYC